MMRARKVVNRARTSFIPRHLGGFVSRASIVRNRAAMVGTAVPEVKVIDNNTVASSGTFGGAAIVPGDNYSPVALNLIQTGSSFFNRVGRKIRGHSLFVELTAQPNGVSNTEVDYHRFLIIYDRQPNGAAPSLADVLNDVSQTNAQTNPANGPWIHLNMNNRERFIVLMDERRVLPPVAASAPYFTSPVVTDMNTFIIKRFIPLKFLETHYKADSSPAVIGDIATGSIIFLAVSNTAIASNGWQWNGSIRTKFDDM